MPQSWMRHEHEFLGKRGVDIDMVTIRDSQKPKKSWSGHGRDFFLNSWRGYGHGHGISQKSWTWTSTRCETGVHLTLFRISYTQTSVLLEPRTYRLMTLKLLQHETKMLIVFRLQGSLEKNKYCYNVPSYQMKLHCWFDFRPIFEFGNHIFYRLAMWFCQYLIGCHIRAPSSEHQWAYPYSYEIGESFQERA